MKLSSDYSLDQTLAGPPNCWWSVLWASESISLEFLLSNMATIIMAMVTHTAMTTLIVIDIITIIQMSTTEICLRPIHTAFPRPQDQHLLSKQIWPMCIYTAIIMVAKICKAFTYILWQMH